MENEKNNQGIRWILIIVSFVIVVLILVNTYILFQNIKTDERTRMELWAIAQREIEQSGLNDDLGDLALEVVSSNSTTPIILVDRYGKIDKYRNIDEEKVKANPNYLEKLLREFANQNEPIPIVYGKTINLKLYYGDSDLLRKLQYYPLALVIIILLFAGVIYFYYSINKVAEQNLLWAGMAKETAHQIGTPLSSFLGWIEHLRGENVDKTVILEMEKDVERLGTITERFSKIGSRPELERTNLIEQTRIALEYLQARSSKLIEFEFKHPQEPIYVNLNPQLYSWTIENLVKNAVDAMKGKGKVEIIIGRHSKTADILVKDEGKGMPKKMHRVIFQPGYTTKTRGWGLGLSLAKRIIEDYHDGTIRVRHSDPESGTVMQISLDIAS